MAEVRKKKVNKKYNVDTMLEENKKKDSKKKKNTNPNKATSKATSSKKETQSKKSLWTRFMIFCHGVKSEFNKVFWPTKKEMVKYSITTILFVIFLSAFFYLIDVIFALIQTLFG